MQRDAAYAYVGETSTDANLEARLNAHLPSLLCYEPHDPFPPLTRPVADVVAEVLLRTGTFVHALIRSWGIPPINLPNPPASPMSASGQKRTSTNTWVKPCREAASARMNC